MSTCSLAPSDKAHLGRSLGSRLAKRYGAKHFYTVDEVRAGLRDLAIKTDWHCWGFALFCSPDVFAAYHRSIGEVCDYAAMKADMVSAVTGGVSEAWFSFDLSWLDWPDIDLGGLFDL